MKYLGRIYPLKGESKHYLKLFVCDKKDIKIKPIPFAFLSFDNGARGECLGGVVFRADKIRMNVVVHECAHMAILSMCLLFKNTLKEMSKKASFDFFNEGVATMTERLFSQSVKLLNGYLKHNETQTT